MSKIGTREEFETARRELERREKEHTRLGDEIARQRQELPWVPVEKEYEFDTPDGRRTLRELFAGRSQLLVYHFMFHPEWDEGCVGCSFLSDHLDGAIPHVNARDITVTCVSRAPLDKLAAYRERLGWRFPWASSVGPEFGIDFGVTTPEEPHRDQPGLSAFVLEDGVVYHTYSAYARGLEALDGAYVLIDRAPKGRQEDPDNAPSWWRRHDEYEDAAA
ncbi:MAG TPA: DUF899 domain-containing protein [Thermoleophilaceae bacterium]|jgi:predicted dithiol-disulfide oxidoreductase (DUF899 family)